MTKSKVILVLAIVVALLSCLFAGCGIPQEEYERVNAELRASQTQAAELQDEIGELKEQNKSAAAQLKASQAQVVELQDEIRELKEQYEIVGETPAETAENIVKRYYETHIYSVYDFYVCSDMALDVWNMLKAQGIDALVQIGNVETGAENLPEVDHAWVLAEVSPGCYLALETTGGYTVREEDDPLYYQGWSFDNPRDYKRFIELRQEYNIRVSIIEQLTTESENIYEEYEREFDYYQELVDEFNEKYAGQPVSSKSLTLKDKIEVQLAIAKEKEGRYNQLTELINEQQQELENIISKMHGLIKAR